MVEPVLWETRRALSGYRRVDQAVCSVAQPTLFVIMFTTVFGGRLGPEGMSYALYIVPGAAAQQTLYFGFATATAISSARDRGRWRDRYGIAGRLLADVTCHGAAFCIVLTVGAFMGARYGGGVLGVIGGGVIVVAFGLAWSTLCLCMGLIISAPEVATMLAPLLLLPITAASSAFSSVEGMNAQAGALARANPFSAICDASRSMLVGAPDWGTTMAAAGWTAGLIAVGLGGLLAVRRRRRSLSALY